jgi:hypothetical protein
MERAIRAMTQSSSGSAQWRTAHNFHLGITFLLANAHVASCGWLGIHEAHLQAFGFGVDMIAVCSGNRQRWRLIFQRNLNVNLESCGWALPFAAG